MCQSLRPAHPEFRLNFNGHTEAALLMGLRPPAAKCCIHKTKSEWFRGQNCAPSVLGGERSGTQDKSRGHPFVASGQDPGVSRNHPLCGAGGQKPFSQFFPRSHLPPSPLEASRGPWCPSSVPGGRCLATKGPSRGEEAHYAIPGAPVRMEAIPRAEVGAAGQVGPGPALCLVK